MRDDTITRRAAGALGAAAGLAALAASGGPAAATCRTKKVQPELVHAHVDEIRFGDGRLLDAYVLETSAPGRMFGFDPKNGVMAATAEELIPSPARGADVRVFQIIGTPRRTAADAGAAGAPATVACSFLVDSGAQDPATGAMRFTATLIGATGVLAAGTLALPDLINASILSSAV